MATISNNDIARAIYLSSKDKSPADQALILPKISQFLFHRRLLSQKDDILSRLDKIINEARGVVVAKISSREKLQENTKKEIVNILKKRYSVGEINLIEQLDDRLLGGFKIEVQDEIIDLTLKNKIIKLQEYLTKSV